MSSGVHALRIGDVVTPLQTVAGGLRLIGRQRGPTPHQRPRHAALPPPAAHQRSAERSSKHGRADSAIVSASTRRRI